MACPFCGGEAEYTKGVRTEEIWGIRCTKCGCTMRMTVHGNKPWNTRVKGV